MIDKRVVWEIILLLAFVFQTNLTNLGGCLNSMIGSRFVSHFTSSNLVSKVLLLLKGMMPNKLKKGNKVNEQIISGYTGLTKSWQNRVSSYTLLGPLGTPMKGWPK